MVITLNNIYLQTLLLNQNVSSLLLWLYLFTYLSYIYTFVFKHTYTDLVPVYDIVAYKKSLRHRLVGLRWYYIEDANLNGFIVSFIKDGFGKKKNFIEIAPTKCSAWPEYYCHDFNYLSDAVTFTFYVCIRQITL